MIMAPPCSTIYHAQRKRFRWKRMFAFTGRLTTVVAWLGLGIGLLWGLCLLYPLVVESAHFQVKHIHINGLRALSADHIRYLLGIPQDRTLWQLDLVRIGARLERHPYIKTVILRREFPDTLLVTVQERVPRLAIQTPQQAVVIDGDAVVMRAWQPEHDAHLLQLTLPQARPMEPGMHLRAAEVQRALELLAAYHASPVAQTMRPVSFTVEPSGASIWKFESYAFTIAFGEGRIDTQLGRLPLVLRYITQQGLAVRSVDLSYRQRVMITPVT